jgi:hypothetical protein
LNTKAAVKRAFIEATVIKADGTRIPLGIVSDTRWRRWDPRRWRATRRIHRYNNTGD